MSEVSSTDSGLSAGKPERRPSSEVLAHLLTPGNLTAISLMIGVITVLTLAATQNSQGVSPLRDWLFTLFALLDLWIVSAVFLILAAEYNERAKLSWARRGEILLSYAGSLLGAAPSMLTMLLCVIAGCSGRVVDLAGVITGALALIVIFVAAALRAQYSTRGVMTAALVGAVLCCLILFERIVLR